MTTKEEIVAKLEKARKSLERTQNKTWSAQDEYDKAEEQFDNAKQVLRLMKAGVEAGAAEVRLWERVLKEIE